MRRLYQAIDWPVLGEVYLVDPGTLRRLDQLEGHPTFYRRTPITLADGREVACYVIPAANAERRGGWLADAPVIPSGDWRAYHRKAVA